jgi:hypothetical protein
MRSLKPFSWPLAAFILISIGTFALEALPFPWHGWQPAYCYPGCFCEAFRAGGIVQPLSSYSNLFYILAGLLILATRDLPAGDRRDNLMTRRRGYITGFGWAVIVLGATSLFYHVSLTNIGRWLDYMGMYAFTGYALAYSVARLRRWNDRTFVVGFGLLLAALGGLWFAAPAIGRALLGALIFGLVAAEAIVHWIRRPMQIRTRWLFASLGCFLLAYWINMFDESGALCVPASPWQWHAVWHLLTAVSTVLLYVYFRTEGEETRRVGEFALGRQAGGRR